MSIIYLKPGSHKSRMIVIIPGEMLFLYWFCEGLPVCNDFILEKLFIISKYKPIFTPNVERDLINWLSHLKLCNISFLSLSLRYHMCFFVRCAIRVPCHFDTHLMTNTLIGHTITKFSILGQVKSITTLTKKGAIRINTHLVAIMSIGFAFINI